MPKQIRTLLPVLQHRHMDIPKTASIIKDKQCDGERHVSQTA